MDQRVKLRHAWFDSAQMSVAAVGGVVAAVAALAKLAGVDWPWAATAGVLLAGLTALLSQTVGPMRARRRERAAAQRRVIDVLHGPPAPIENLDPYTMGVFPSDAAAAAWGPGRVGTRPPYVERAIDSVLRPAIGAMGRTGGLIVVRGDPKCGKSRTLWEALVDQVRGRIVYGLRGPVGPQRHTLTPISTFVAERVVVDGGRSIIWIDDAHEHIGHGLTDDVLVRDLLGRYPGVIVALTVHSHRLQVVEQAEGSVVLEDAKLIRRLKEASDPFQLDARWDAGELSRARNAYQHLGEDVVDWADLVTLARWFAGVDHLLERYSSQGSRFTNPHGVAIAKAAIDWRRAGMPVGITHQQLRELAVVELADLDPNARLTDDSFQRALDWATGEEDIRNRRYRWKGVALIRRIADTDPVLWKDFDAVTAAAPTIDGPLTARCWDFIAQHVTPEIGTSVGLAAYDAGNVTLAENALRLSADRDDVMAMATLGAMLYIRGDKDAVIEAEQWHRRAIAQGHPGAMVNLGTLLRERGDKAGLSEAEQWYRRALSLMPDFAATKVELGILLTRRGDEASLAEAEQLWRDAADQGLAPAMNNLGVVLRARGNEAEAEYWFDRAREAGDGAAKDSP